MDRRRKETSPLGRLPAPALEAAVADRIAVLFSSPSDILAGLKRLDRDDLNYERLLKLEKAKATGWSTMAQIESPEVIRKIVHRAIVHEGSIELAVNVDALVEFLEGRAACTSEHPASRRSFPPTLHFGTFRRAIR